MFPTFIHMDSPLGGWYVQFHKDTMKSDVTRNFASLSSAVRGVRCKSTYCGARSNRAKSVGACGPLAKSGARPEHYMADKYFGIFV